MWFTTGTLNRALFLYPRTLLASHIEFIWAIYQLPNHTFFPGGFLWMPQPAQPTLGSSLAVTSVNARQELVNKHHRSHALWMGHSWGVYCALKVIGTLLTDVVPRRLEPHYPLHELASSYCTLYWVPSILCLLSSPRLSAPQITSQRLLLKGQWQRQEPSEIGITSISKDENTRQKTPVRLSNLLKITELLSDIAGIKTQDRMGLWITLHLACQ